MFKSWNLYAISHQEGLTTMQHCCESPLVNKLHLIVWNFWMWQRCNLHLQALGKKKESEGASKKDEEKKSPEKKEDKDKDDDDYMAVD